MHFSKISSCAICVFCLIFNLHSKAQSLENKLEVNLFYQTYLEDLQQDNEEVDLMEYLEYIEELRKNPLKINSVKLEELSRLFFLSAFQIQNFYAYQKKYGKLKSLLELQAIPGFDENTIAKLLPLIKLDQPIN